MLGCIAAVIEIVSPSQPNPPVIQMMWTSSTPDLVAIMYLLEQCPFARGLLKKPHTISRNCNQLQFTEVTTKITTVEDTRRQQSPSRVLKSIRKKLWMVISS